MSIRKGRVLFAIIILLSSIIITINLLKAPTESVVNKVLEHEKVRKFVDAHDEKYGITLLSVEELRELKNSQQYGLYVSLPDKPVYRITVLEDNKGYLAFVDAQTKTLIEVMEVYNLIII